jgi:Holliday junction DNA helicase RuvB
VNRVISGEPEPFEATDKALRPQTLAEFVGQEPIKANLQVFINAARPASARPPWPRSWPANWA